MTSLFRVLATIPCSWYRSCRPRRNRSNFRQTCGYRMARGERNPWDSLSEKCGHASIIWNRRRTPAGLAPSSSTLIISPYTCFFHKPTWIANWGFSWDAFL